MVIRNMHGEEQDVDEQEQRDGSHIGLADALHPGNRQFARMPYEGPD
jgi:hypothetical protein